MKKETVRTLARTAALLIIPLLAVTQVAKAGYGDHGNSVPISYVCSSANASGGSFNIDALCPSGDVPLGGGWLCSDSMNNPVSATISVNTFFGAAPPSGWMTIGTAASSPNTPVTCTVCASCTPGQGECHRSDFRPCGYLGTPWP
jgi:hypothetical protein